METDYTGNRMTDDDDTATPDANEAPAAIKRNRAQRRALVFGYASREHRRNLCGRGRWRRALTADTGRYDFPFATRLDG